MTATHRRRSQRPISTQPTSQFYTLSTNTSTSSLSSLNSSNPPSPTPNSKEKLQGNTAGLRPRREKAQKPSASSHAPPVDDGDLSDSQGSGNGDHDANQSSATYSADPNSATAKYPRTGKRGAPQVFARKLYEILENEPPDAISWTSSGTSFLIKDMDTFVTDVLMKYFRHQKYSSFQRQLNLYGFRKISKGGDAGAYAHESFVQGKPELLYHVRRMPQASAPATTTYSKPSKPSRSSKKRCPPSISRLTDCFENKQKGNNKAKASSSTTSSAAARRSRRQQSARKRDEFEYDDETDEFEESDSLDEEESQPPSRSRKNHPTRDQRKTKVARAANLTPAEATVVMSGDTTTTVNGSLPRRSFEEESMLDERKAPTAQLIEPVIAQQLFHPTSSPASSSAAGSTNGDDIMESLPFEAELVGLSASQLEWDTAITSQPVESSVVANNNDGAAVKDEDDLPVDEEQLNDDIAKLFLDESADSAFNRLQENTDWFLDVESRVMSRESSPLIDELPLFEGGASIVTSSFNTPLKSEPSTMMGALQGTPFTSGIFTSLDFPASVQHSIITSQPASNSSN